MIPIKISTLVKLKKEVYNEIWDEVASAFTLYVQKTKELATITNTYTGNLPATSYNIDFEIDDAEYIDIHWRDYSDEETVSLELQFIFDKDYQKNWTLNMDKRIAEAKLSTEDRAKNARRKQYEILKKEFED